MAEDLLKHRQNPHKYEMSNKPVARDTAEFVPKILRIMGTKGGEGKLYLDYGCGSGSTCWRYLVWQAELTKSTIYAVDISEDMIEYARNHYPHPRVEYFVGDILTDWPLANVEFDGIFAIYSLMLMADYKKALEVMYNQLKPNGKIGIMIPDKYEFFGMMKRLKEDPFWSEYTKTVFYPDYTETNTPALDVYIPFMKSLGFNILKVNTYPRSHKYKNLEKPVEFFTSVNPFAEHLSTELQDQLKKWYTEDLKKWPQSGKSGSEVASDEENVEADVLDDQPFDWEYTTVLILAEKK